MGAIGAFLGPVLPALKLIGKVLAFGVTIPVGVILAAVAWAHFDKNSAVRKAVGRAVVELVAGAELKAAQATAEAQRQIAEELRHKADRLAKANEMHASLLADARAREEGLQDELDDLAARPVNGACAVDDDVLGRLRNR